MRIVEGIARCRRVPHYLAKPWVAVDGGHRQQVDATRVIVVEGGATQHGRLQRTGKGFVFSVLFLTHRQSRLKKGKRLKTRDTKEEKEGLRHRRSKRNGSRERPAPQEQQGAAKGPRAGPEGRGAPKGQGQDRKAGHRQRAKDWAGRQGGWARRQGGVLCVSGSVCLGCAKALSQALSPPRRRSRALAVPCFPTLLLTSRLPL